jgi:hypothetical protein
MHPKAGVLQTLDPVSQAAAAPPVVVDLPRFAACARLTLFRLALASRARVRQREVQVIRARWGRLTLAVADLPAPIIALRRVDTVAVQRAVGVEPLIDQSRMSSRNAMAAPALSPLPLTFPRTFKHRFGQGSGVRAWLAVFP